jgi:hypothetical protein
MSNYTQLGFVKQTDGENTGTWGDVLNENLIDLLDDAIGGYVEVSVASGNVTLAFADGTADNNGRHAVIKFTGSPGTTRTVTFPDKQINYFIVNGSDSSVICTSGDGTATVTIPTGMKDVIYIDGSDEVYSMFGTPHLSSSGNFTVDATTDIILDADGGDVFFKDGGTTFGSATNTSGNLIIKSGTTTAVTFSGANATVAGNLSVGGDFDVTGSLDFSDADITNVGSIQLDSIAGDGDTNTSITFSGSDVITIAAGGDNQITFNNGSILPVTDNDIDLGSGSYEFKDAYFDGTVTTDALTADTANIDGGSIDGATLGTNSAITQAVIDNVNINGATIGHTDDTDLITLADGIATVAGEISVTTLDIGGTNVTSTAAEINLIDGGTSRGTTAVASGDGILINDGGTMRMTNVDTVSTYFASHSVGGGNIVTTGALDSGSITSGFGTIDTGSSTITTTGLITGGSLDIDNVLINGTTIGHTDDTDLITVADGLVTVAGEISVTTLDIGGTNVASTAAELNIMDGGTAASSITLADADRLVTNDDGTMKQVALTTLKTYLTSAGFSSEDPTALAIALG